MSVVRTWAHAEQSALKSLRRRYDYKTCRSIVILVFIVHVYLRGILLCIYIMYKTQGTMIGCTPSSLPLYSSGAALLALSNVKLTTVRNSDDVTANGGTIRTDD